MPASVLSASTQLASMPATSVASLPAALLQIERIDVVELAGAPSRVTTRLRPAGLRRGRLGPVRIRSEERCSQGDRFRKECV